jgi:hypothetical protein
MTVLEIFEAIGTFFVGMVVIKLLVMALRIYTSDKNTYKRNNRLSGGVMSTLRGGVNPRSEQDYDYITQKGLARNIDTNQWVEQGALSDYAVHSILRKD